MDDLFDGTPDERPEEPSSEADWSGLREQLALCTSGTVLELRFPCTECEEMIYSDELTVPGLNLAAEKSRDVAGQTDTAVDCGTCGSTYIFDLVFDGSTTLCSHDDLDDGDIEARVLEEPQPEDFYFDEYAEAVASNSGFYATFEDGLRTVRALAGEGANFPDNLATALYRMLFANVITLVETYLSDALVVTTMSNDDRVGKALRRLGHFREREVRMSDVLDLATKVRSEVRKYLVSVLYHDLDRVADLYVTILGIRLPDVPEQLSEAILTRHDIVHRNGKDKEGNDVQVDANAVRALADEVEVFISTINDSVRELDPPESPDDEK